MIKYKFCVNGRLTQDALHSFLTTCFGKEQVNDYSAESYRDVIYVLCERDIVFPKKIKSPSKDGDIILTLIEKSKFEVDLKPGQKFNLISRVSLDRSKFKDHCETKLDLISRFLSKNGFKIVERFSIRRIEIDNKDRKAYMTDIFDLNLIVEVVDKRHATKAMMYGMGARKTYGCGGIFSSLEKEVLKEAA